MIRTTTLNLGRFEFTVENDSTKESLYTLRVWDTHLKEDIFADLSAPELIALRQMLSDAT